MSGIQAFCIFIAIFAFADFVSVKSKAWLPSMFTIAVLSIAGYWSGILPTDFFELTGISIALVYVIYYFQLVNMGAIIGIDEMKRQWKTILIAGAGLIGIGIGALLIAGPIFGRDFAIAGAPPLSGGIVAYEIIREAAMRLGREDLAMVAIAVYVLQSFVGYPLTSYFLKKEAVRLKGNLDEIRELKSQNEEKTFSKKRLIPPVPEKYNTENLIIFKLAIIGVLGIAITEAINRMAPNAAGGDTISRYVILLILGVFFNQIGFLDNSPVRKAQISGFQNIIIIGFSVIGGLATATPEIVFSTIGPTIGIIVAGVVGLAIFSLIAGRFLGYSKEMAISVALTALYGYPGTEMLSKESVRVIAENEEEYDLLLSQIMPQMIVGGFTTVTFGSVFFAGIMVNFL